VQYPEQTKRRKLLRCLFREINRAHARGKTELELRFHAQPRKFKGGWFGEGETIVPFRWLGVYVADSGLNITEELGLGAAECISLIETLATTGYLGGYREPIHIERSSRDNKRILVDHGKENQRRWISYLTDLALREIEELPDPHTELMQRLDLAILQIQQDSRLSAPQKRQAINWLQEGTVLARTLSIDAIKAILVGAIL
jgi:hypothetical protein